MNTCLLPSFKKCQIEDMPLISSYLKKADYLGSDYNVVNMTMWDVFYPLYYYEEADFLLIACFHDDNYYLYMPLCDSSCFEKALLRAQELFLAASIKFRLIFFDEEHKDRALSLFKDIEAQELVNSFDYIYDMNSFRTFVGKKMQKKRNHLNNFYKNYQDRFVYEDLNENNIQELYDFVRNLDCEDDEVLKIEKEGIFRLLDNHQHLRYESGLIRIDSRIEAFIIASDLNSMCVQENVEKADKNITGLYQAMIKEFFGRHFLDKIYIDREDDAGIDDLRLSKSSYHPCGYVHKYMLE